MEGKTSITIAHVLLIQLLIINIYYYYFSLIREFPLLNTLIKFMHFLKVKLSSKEHIVP